MEFEKALAALDECGIQELQSQADLALLCSVSDCIVVNGYLSSSAFSISLIIGILKFALPAGKKCTSHLPRLWARSRRLLSI